ncbi:solute carrier family 23 member 1-like [Lissotriton helveticus]
MASPNKNPSFSGVENPTFLTEDGNHNCVVIECSDSGTELPEKDNKGSHKDASHNKMLYGVTEIPPWHLCIFLGVQHYLTALGGNLSIPLILSKELCLTHDPLSQSHIISTTFFVSGLCTILQVILGVRLPILEGASPAFLTPALTMLSLPKWKCPDWTQNASLVNTTSLEFKEVWQSRMREIQGAIMVASCLQILMGFSGLIGFVMRFLGPLTIAPTICLIALPLFTSAGRDAGSHWGISAMTFFLIIVFSQYLRKIPVPCPTFTKARKCHFTRFNIFQLFPMLFGICISWLVCYILTLTNALPSNPASYGYLGRTDVKGRVVAEAPWFRFPYPGQWGRPTINVGIIVGMLAAVIATMVDAIGDYHSCARLAGAPPPTRQAVNRGIGIQGINVLLTGAWGSGIGIGSFGANIGALGITKVGSRIVLIVAGILAILVGVISKIGAVFSTLPSPVIGGLFIVMFGVLTGVGLSTLQFADMNSSRNIFIVGFSLFIGLTVPNWVSQNARLMETGISQLDQVIQALLTTGMLVGGFFGFILDNTIPGTPEERGIVAWKEELGGGSDDSQDPKEIYGLPFGVGTKCCAWSWTRFLPFWPKPKRKNASSGIPEDGCLDNATNREIETRQ